MAPPVDQPKRRRKTLAVRMTLIAIAVIYVLGIIGYGLNVREYDELDVFLDTYGTGGNRTVFFDRVFSILFDI